MRHDSKIEYFTLRRVVMAYVAILLLESVIKFSMSKLQAATAWGWV